jgi:hypothetical protein
MEVSFLDGRRSFFGCAPSLVALSEAEGLWRSAHTEMLRCAQQDTGVLIVKGGAQ